MNDGVCDCCDGSDEWGPTLRGDEWDARSHVQPHVVHCANTCGGADAKVSVDEMQRGARSRMEYAKTGKKYGAEGALADAAYYSLSDRCFDIKSGHFTYSVCPFGKATQSEPGKTDIIVGHWAGIDGAGDRSAGQHVMVFEGGDSCGDVNRSLKVEVRCGDEDRILSESEPTMCSYLMKMKSPAACDAAALAEANLDAEGNPLEPGNGPEKDEIVYHNEL